MKLIKEESDNFITAKITQKIDGEQRATTLTNFPVPEEISDIQEYLRIEFLKRMEPMIGSAVESIRGSMIDSIHNATFSEIHYVKVGRKVFSIEDNAKNLEF